MTFLAIVALTGLLCVTDPKPEDNSEWLALKAIQKAGGMTKVTIDLEFSDPTFADKNLEVILERLLAMPHLRSLDLSKTAVTAKGLAKLRGLKQLKMLGVSAALFKDPVIQELRKANERLGVHGPFMPISGGITPAK